MPPRKSPQRTARTPIPNVAKPKPKNVFNLDALERDGRPEPFIARVGGLDFEFADPAELDWQIQELGGRAFMRAMLGAEQFEAFCALPAGTVPDWKLEQLAEHIRAHYAAGEETASPSS